MRSHFHFCSYLQNPSTKQEAYGGRMEPSGKVTGWDAEGFQGFLLAPPSIHHRGSLASHWPPSCRIHRSWNSWTREWHRHLHQNQVEEGVRQHSHCTGGGTLVCEERNMKFIIHLNWASIWTVARLLPNCRWHHSRGVLFPEEPIPENRAFTVPPGVLWGYPTSLDSTNDWDEHGGLEKISLLLVSGRTLQNLPMQPLAEESFCGEAIEKWKPYRWRAETRGRKCPSKALFSACLLESPGKPSELLVPGCDVIGLGWGWGQPGQPGSWHTLRCTS